MDELQPWHHRHAFDRDPITYSRARPPYPDEVYDILVRECGLGPGRRVLEIGAGTGQATAELLERGAEVVAVEPGPALAGVLADRLRGRKLQIIRADFEDAALPPGPYDLVVAATAFHWVDPAAALPKIASVLAPDGTLAVWWTVFGDPDRQTEFRTALERVYELHLPDQRRDTPPGPLRVASWTDELQRGGWFGPVAVDVIRWTHQLTAAGARGLWSTFSGISELPAATRERFLDDLEQTVDEHGGTVDDPRVTAIYRTRSRRESRSPAA